ncbi:MAG: nuclear transport factor 2 family protein [Bacteroidota bacterium]
MKYIITFLIISLVFSCSEPSDHLTSDETDKIKKQIIERSEKHASDLENMDFESVMTFYSENLIFFGDGYYWGDYKTADGLWKDILEGGWKDILYWDLQNHKIHVFSKNAASYLVEFDHKHLEQNGDTVGSSGCFTYGMEKIDGEWKAVTGHVTHIPERTNDEKWWSKYASSNSNQLK